MRFGKRVAGRRALRSLVLGVIGMLFGFSSVFFVHFLREMVSATLSESTAECSAFYSAQGSSDTMRRSNRGLVLVGIMTAAKYIDSRAYNVWKTWAQRIPGKVLFFVAEDTQTAYPELPVIRLKGVDDTYPPQKKSFAMLRWMHENHLSDFDWFLRADDDLYIRGEELESFLRSLDASKPHFLGQAGLGNSAEYGQLALGRRDNYCMGGPGVVFSRETLRMVAPHLQTCLLELLTTHEDVELGRCVRKYVGVACSWNYEMTTLFHNNRSTEADFKGWGTNEQLRHAITMHPVKEPELMRRIHRENLITRIRELRSKQALLIQAKSTAQLPNLIRRPVNSTKDIPHWDYTALNKITFCANGINCPRHTIDFNMRSALGDIVNDLFDGFNANARQRGRVLQFQSIQYSYSRVEPRHGVDYILDIILWFKKFRPPHRATLSVRRHAYVQQTFGEIEAIGDEDYVNVLQSSPTGNETNQPESTVVFSSSAESKSVYLVMPLRGRATTFKRFAANMLEILPPSEKSVELVLVFYASGNETEDTAIRDQATALGVAMPVRIVDMGDAEFNRGRALSTGASSLPANALMFFTDVDMLLTYDVIERIRANTILGVQAYFPIVFSEFAPESWSSGNDDQTAGEDGEHDTTMHYAYDRSRGYFRHFGFGLVALYHRDFDSVGGFNLTIHGWGMEDVDLFEKVIASKGLRVMRAPEPGLVHVYHAIRCADDMSDAQKKMCSGSKAASLASLDFLAERAMPYSA